VVAASVVLAVIAWSPLFEPHYLPWARILVPLRSAVIAIYVARAASEGQADLLMVLLPAVMGPFFFLGLPFRTALLAGATAMLSFVIGVVAFQLPLPIAVRSCGFMLMGLAACAIAALCLEKRSRISFLEAHLIAQIAEQDSLTGTKNRRVFDEHLAGLWSRAIDERRCLSILLIDVDHFKAYNDCYGHQAGDQALRRVSQAVQTFIRSPLDILARYGGEEFAAVLYDVDGRKAKDIADQMRCAVEDLRIEHRGSRSCSGVTISVGVAAIEPTRERDPRGALQLADQALYDAKTRGRNRVELMNEAEYRMLVTGVFSRDAARAAAQ
jgi:diguanylate cyclase (GGDEF)-like protein